MEHAKEVIPDQVKLTPTVKQGNCGADNDLEGDSFDSVVDHHLVGLSALYWSYVHLTAVDVQCLSIVRGIHCMTASAKATECVRDDLHVPVSKCQLCGVIVGVDRKSNGSILYILDDGSDLIDCIQWDPYLNDFPEMDGQNSMVERVNCGDTVTVFGVIRSVVNGNDYIREIHIEKIQVCRYHSPNDETFHWLKCVHNGKRVVNKPKNQILFPTLHSRMNPESSYFFRLQNGNDIVSELKQNHELISRPDCYRDDWEYFGVDCKCEIFHKSDLLYCHCHAKYVKHDPEQRFRDNLLKILLEAEHNLPNEKNGFFFTFKSMKENADIIKAGLDVVGSKDMYMLLVATFDALRNDGIIYLHDERLDEYLLLSRSLIKSFIKESLVSKLLKDNPPPYLKCIPRRRISHVKRKMFEDNKTNDY